MINFDEIEKELKPAITFVNENLNPHQALVITTEGIKIMSVDLSIPNKEGC